jgi:putative transposase
MGCSIQFESHRDELPFVYLLEHDPQVLEFYDQPYGQIKLTYPNKDGTRKVTAKHTPLDKTLGLQKAGLLTSVIMCEDG